MLLKNESFPAGEGGFTLMELLVTILIVTVGLLGLAKLQATAVSNTAVARTRALMTYQAESLAGMIRANKGFWQTSGAGPFPSFFVSSLGAPSDSGAMVQLGSTGSCANLTGTNTCTPANLAWDDMYTWAKAFNDHNSAASAFPGASASIICVPASGGTCAANPTSPHGYDITLTWQQKLVAMNSSTSAPSAQMTQAVSMVMHVQP